MTFDHREPQAENITSFYFKPPKTVRYEAGQYIELTLPHDNPDERGIRHWFTLSSSPTEELLTITTKFATDRVSTFKQTLRALKPGDQVQMSDPMGDFVLPKDANRQLVFIAGGIGVTPMRSMIKWLHDKQQRRMIHLLYAAQTPEQFAFRELFNNYGLPTTLIVSDPPKGWQGETGRLSAELILKLAPNVDHKLYYISGPEPMVEKLRDDLEAADLKPEQIVGDYFPNYPAP